MKKSILLLAACAIAIVGCKKEKDEGVAIEISSKVQTSTKAAILDSKFPKDTENVFQVSATTVKGDLSTAYFNDAMVSTVGETPTFTPSRFYPSSGELFFYAAAPVCENSVYGKEPIAAYNLSSPHNQDIMWAAADKGYSKGGANGSPAFEFKHKLMMFKFQVKGTGAVIGRFVKKVEVIEQPIKANLNMVTGSLTFSTAPGDKGTVLAYDADKGTGIEIKTDFPTDKKDTFGCAMIAPSTQAFKIRVAFGNNDGSTPSVLEATGKLTATSGDQTGLANTIEMTITATDIAMTTTITPWGEGLGGNVSFE